MKNEVIENGVKNLKEFGYPNVNSENIFTDEIYRAFFKSMLKDSMDMTTNKTILNVLKELLSKIN